MQSQKSTRLDAGRLRVRAAESADIPFLAEIDHIATLPPLGRSFWEDLTEPTGTPFKTVLEAMYRVGASNWGAVEDFLIIEVDGAPAAACAVFDASDDPAKHRPFNIDRLPALAAQLGWSDDVTAGFADRYRDLWSLAGSEVLKPQAPAIVESVGVLPAHRGLGLGRRLMEAAFDEARRRGHDAIGILVIHGNDPAHRLYEQYFEPYVSYHAAYFDGEFPGLTKFRAKL